MMKYKKLVVMVALISAVCFMVSAFLYFFINIQSMMRLLPETKKNLTVAEKAILEKIHYPDWKTYYITYFLMLFMIIGSVAIWAANAHPDLTGSTVAMIMQILSMGLMVLIYKDLRVDKCQFMYNKFLFKASLLFMILSFLLLIAYAVIMSIGKNKGAQKKAEAIEEKRMNTKIVVLDKCTLTVGDIDFSAIDALGNTEYYDILTKPEIIERCKDADVILCNKAVIDREIMDNCPRLSYIGLFATGYNNIDITAAKERNITVCNAPGYSTDSVAQLVFAYILNHTTSLDKYNESTHNGEWIRSTAFSYFPYPINELSGKTLCVIGYGAIGKKVAKLGDAFGMKVRIATRTAPVNCPYPLITVDEAFAQAAPGDLVCYYGHVGIYIGGGQIVHASNPRDGIKVSNATYRTPYAVRRILP